MSDELEGKTYLVGIGGQKCGTTWLHDYFQNRDDVLAPRIKELHYFDTRYLPVMQERMARHFCSAVGERAASLPVDPTPNQVGHLSELTDRLLMNHCDGAYLDFYRRRIKPTHRVFIDITPAYALLPVEGFEEIRAQHRNVRVVFILRDPVERFYSVVREAMERDPTRPLEAKFRNHLKLEEHRLRSSYHITLERLFQVFTDDEVLVEFYEDLFNDQTMARICDFVGLEFRPGNYGRPKHATGLNDEAPPELIDLARREFDETYRYCRARFGSRIPAAWRL